MSYKEVTWGISYVNMIMLGASIPKYDKNGNEIENSPPQQITGADMFARFGVQNTGKWQQKK